MRVFNSQLPSQIFATRIIIRPGDAGSLELKKGLHSAAAGHSVPSFILPHILGASPGSSESSAVPPSSPASVHRNYIGQLRHQGISFLVSRRTACGHASLQKSPIVGLPHPQDTRKLLASKPRRQPGGAAIYLLHQISFVSCRRALTSCGQ